MNLKTFAVIFGIVFIVIGVLGFIPALTPNEHLFGLFMVNPYHNFVHIFTGIIALFAAAKESYARIYFQVFGIIYAIVAVLGFILAGNLILMHVNFADNILHLIIALIALYLGFFSKETSSSRF